MFGSHPSGGPFGAIPGLAPRLIHRLRQQPRIDTSAFSRLTQMPEVTSPLQPVGSIPAGVASPVIDLPIRHAEQVAAGLGLTYEAERDLTEQVREWMQAPDPITLRRSLFKGLRSFAPRDHPRRNEIAKRVLSLWKASARTSPIHRDPRHVIVQKSEKAHPGMWTEAELLKYRMMHEVAVEPPLELRRRMRLTIGVPRPPELVWMTRELDELGDQVDDTPPGWREPEMSKPGRLVVKAAGHKYIKRTRRPNPPPKYRYYYRQPKGKGLTSSEDLHQGAKFKVAHRGQEGHFEVVKHHKKKGVVEVKHDESGQTAFVKERDLHRMIASYHAKKTAKATGKPAPKAPAKLRTATMSDLQNGEYDNVEGFGEVSALEFQAAGMPKDRDYAIIAQPGGHILVSKRKREKGKRREIKGEKTDLKLRSSSGKGVENLAAEFVLVEASDLVASHQPKALGNFPVHPRYPENVQERRYHAISAEQEKVDRIAKNLDPAILVNTNPDAVNGAPIMDQHNAILGGNGRTMAIQMAYAQYPESAQRMKDYLVANARKYGFAAADVRAMEQPALVRRVQVEAGKGNANLKMLGRRMNEALTQGLDPRSEEVAVSQFVTENVCQSLVDTIDPGQTLADFLHSSAAEGFVVSLRQAGIIDELNKAQYLEHDKDGKAVNRLNEDGRNRVERVMAARLIPDADLLQRMNPELRRVLALSTPSLIVAEQHGWPVGPSLKTAVEADLHIRERYQGQRSDAALRNFLGQTEATETGVDVAQRVHDDPVALALLQVIRGKIGPKMTPRDFRGFAARAVQDYHDHAFSEGRSGATGTLLGFASSRMTPAEALDIEFGLSPAAAAKKRQRIQDEKDRAAAEKRAEAERKRLAKLQSEDQSQLFAASEYNQKPDLVKAMDGQNRLMNRVVWHTQYLVDAAVANSTSTSSSRKPRINASKIVAQVMDDVRSAAKKDSSYARDLGAQPITEATVRGLIESMTAMTSLDVAVAKSVPTGDLRKAEIELPPPPPPPKRQVPRRRGKLARIGK